jgi:hypothetical protein
LPERGGANFGLKFNEIWAKQLAFGSEPTGGLSVKRLANQKNKKAFP